MPTKIVFTSHIPEVLKGMEDTARERMAESVDVITMQTRETLSGSRSGRTYTVPGTSRTYTASSPGEAPAARMGELRKTIKGFVKRENRNIIGVVGTELDYGAFLQVGTRTIAPRPWLDVAFRAAWDKVVAIWSRPWLS